MPTGKAFVFHTDVDSVAEPEFLASCGALLSEEELHRHGKFRFADDRHLYLVAHALLRSSLSRYANVAPEAWCFDVGPNGRPEVSREQRFLTNLRFNLSHTRQLAACVIARDVDVGIDVERLDRNVDAESIACRYFAPSESAQLAILAGKDHAKRFLELWTLKEAYVKARGGGLSIPLNRFHFDLDDDGEWRIGFAAPNERHDQWQFACLQPTANHIMSIAIHRREQPNYEVVIHEAAPIR
jgi:4'-phosphopantetheinyl transferase